MTNKYCGKCRQTKPKSEFYKSKTLADGLQAWCKTCKKTKKVGVNVQTRLEQNRKSLKIKSGEHVLTFLQHNDSVHEQEIARKAGFRSPSTKYVWYAGAKLTEQAIRARVS